MTILLRVNFEWSAFYSVCSLKNVIPAVSTRMITDHQQQRMNTFSGLSLQHYVHNMSGSETFRLITSPDDAVCVLLPFKFAINIQTVVKGG